MKIFMVTERYLPIWGGAENQLSQLVPHLISKGCAVTILTRRYQKSWLADEEMQGARVVRLGPAGEGAMATLGFIISLLIYIFLERRNIDILHSHGAVKMGSLCSVMARLLRLKNVTKIATAGKFQVLKKNILGRLIIKSFKGSDKIIAMTGEIENELQEIGVKAEQIARIFNGVDCERFMPVTYSEKNQIKNGLGIPPTGLVVVFSGRLVQRKGLDLVIDSWADLLTENSDIHFYILGSGVTQKDTVEVELRQKVEKGNLANIHFVGATSDVGRYLQCCDIYVFPSRLEGFPNALLEAMASECAVVASDIGGVRPLIDDGSSGFLFEMDNRSEFTEKFMALEASENLRAQFGKAARKKIVDNFSFEKIGGDYLALYKRLLGMDK